MNDERAHTFLSIRQKLRLKQDWGDFATRTTANLKWPTQFRVEQKSKKFLPVMQPAMQGTKALPQRGLQESISSTWLWLSLQSLTKASQNCKEWLCSSSEDKRRNSSQKCLEQIEWLRLQRPQISSKESNLPKRRASQGQLSNDMINTRTKGRGLDDLRTRYRLSNDEIARNDLHKLRANIIAATSEEDRRAVQTRLIESLTLSIKRCRAQYQAKKPRKRMWSHCLPESWARKW